MDFSATTSALGQIAIDFRTFLLAQGLVIASVLAVIGGFVLVVSTLRKKTGLTKRIDEHDDENDRRYRSAIADGYSKMDAAEYAYNPKRRHNKGF